MYARAMFEAARDEGRVERVHADLGTLRDDVAGSDDLAVVLSNPEIDSRVKGDILSRIAEGSDELVVNFVRLIAEKGRAASLVGIVDEFDALVAEAARILDVELTTAYALSDAEFGRILAQIEQASSRKVQATRSVDGDLIGGIVLQAGSMRLDASIRGRLDRLRHELSTGPVPVSPLLLRGASHAVASLPPGEARLRRQRESLSQLSVRQHKESDESEAAARRDHLDPQGADRALRRRDEPRGGRLGAAGR